MSFGSCACPPAAAITTIPANTCGINIGQVQRLIIARYSDSAIADIEDAALEATWTTLEAAVNSTKHQFTPFIENVVIPQGTAILEGGDDNTTLDGNPIVVGVSQIPVTGSFRSLSTAVLTALQSYNCEDNLMVYLINQFGNIIGRNPTGTVFTGFRMSSFFVGDPGNEGLNTHDKAPASWNFRYQWRSKLAVVTPSDFDALMDF